MCVCAGGCVHLHVCVCVRVGPCMCMHVQVHVHAPKCVRLRLLFPSLVCAFLRTQA